MQINGLNNVPADVDKKNRLKVVGQGVNSEVVASVEGRAFFYTSGVVNLTSANKSAITYIKNTSNQDLVLYRTTFHLGTSTGGTGDTRYHVALSPTGTVTSSGTAVTVFNVNIGKLISNTFDGTALKGAEGLTAVSSSTEVVGIYNQPGLFSIDSSIILPKGQSLSTLITPPTSNTSMNVVIDYLLYFLDAETGD